MRRALASLLVVALLAVAAVPAAAGGRPEKWTNEPIPLEVYEPGVLCPFTTTIEDLENTSHNILFPPTADGTQRMIGAGRIVLRVANADNGRSVTYNASGPGTFLVDGDLLTIAGQGPWLLYAFPGDAGGPGVWYVRGAFALEVDLVTGTWLALDLPHNVVDVCALLS